jgi:2-dehydropantoate 2-reductase
MNERAGDRIAVVGVGAIGGALAADLMDVGRHELVLCTRTPFDRLRVTHPGGRSDVSVATAPEPARARTAFEEDAPADWILLATKAHQSPGAVPWLDALCGPHTRVAILQNGVDHVERIRPLVPAGTPLVPVVIQLPAEKRAPGEIEQSHVGLLFVPDDDDGTAACRACGASRARACR